MDHPVLSGGFKTSLPVLLGFLALGVLVGFSPAAAVAAPSPAGLARDCFAAASTLDAGLPSASLLQERIYVSSRHRDRIDRIVRDSYGHHVMATRRFKASASELLDRPEDPAALFRTLTDGYRACWRFDAFTRLVETYGVSGQDLLSVMSAAEACGTFRDVAFEDAVLERVRRVLAGPDARDEEIRRLREELAELEALLDDLRRMDDAP